jgi:DNA polymerase sigma
MTPEKEIEIIRWMKDNYPTFETNTTQIWQMARMLNDYHESEVKKLNILAVSSMFTDDELKVIKTDILHIYEKVSLDENQVHKRNLILNKIKLALGDEYYR